MELAFILGFAAGIATPSAAKKVKAKIKPWLGRIKRGLGRLLQSLLDGKDG